MRINREKRPEDKVLQRRHTQKRLKIIRMEDIYKDSEATLREATSSEYKYGFTSDIDTDIVPPGLSEDEIGRAHV